MHTIYEKLWLISSELNHLTKVNKKSLYMGYVLDTCGNNSLCCIGNFL